MTVASADGEGAPTTDDWEASLSPLQKRQWDRLAVGMKRFHDHFASDFKTIYQHADSYEKLGVDLAGFIAYAASLSSYLHTHHGIEERWIFPVLAERMPEFQGDLPEQHRGIHDGLDRYDECLRTAQQAPSTYDPSKLRQVMDSFRDVLFTHLDAEVAALRGNNMHKYWSLDELGRIPL